MHMADLVSWLLTLLVKGKPGKAYNVGSDEPISIENLAHKVSKFSGKGVIVQGKNGGDCYVPASFNSHSGLELQTNISLDDALERTWRWLQ